MFVDKFNAFIQTSQATLNATQRILQDFISRFLCFLLQIHDYGADGTDNGEDKWAECGSSLMMKKDDRSGLKIE